MVNLRDKIKDCVDETMIVLWNELNFLEEAVRNGEYSNEYIANCLHELRDLVD